MDRPLKIALVAPSMAILGGQAVQAARLLEAWHDDPDIHAWLVPINPAPPRLLRRAVDRRVRADGRHAAELLAPARPRAAPGGRRPRLLGVVLLVPARAAAGGPGRQAARQAGRDELPQRRGAGSPASARRSRAPSLRHVDRNAVPSRFLQDVFARLRHRAPRSSRTSSTSSASRSATEPLRSEGPVDAQLRERSTTCHARLRAFRLVQDRYPDATLTLVGAGTQEPAIRALAAEPAPRRRHVRRTRAARRRSGATTPTPTSTCRRPTSTTCPRRCSRPSRAAARSSRPTPAACPRSSPTRARPARALQRR